MAPRITLIPPLFDEPNTIYDRHETTSTWCHVGHHVDYTSIIWSLFDPLGLRDVEQSEVGPQPIAFQLK
jgi:hypothetical protein